MASCVVRSIYRAARKPNWITAAAAAYSPITTKIQKKPFSNSPNSKTSPWLILPPSYEGKNMIYNFYNLTDKKVISISKRENDEEEEEEKEELGLAAQPDDDADLVGSSHGWLALRNKRNHDLFLSNPLTRRHVKLPPLHTLPADGSHNLINKVIVSGSPDDKGCHAMMSFGPGSRLAVCRPGLSKEWAPTTTPTSRRYTDYAYYYASIGVRKRFFICVANGGYLELWDLDDPESPERDYSDRLDYLYEHNMDARHDKETDVMRACGKAFRCVAHGDRIFVITRYVTERAPHQTVGFDVHEFNLEEMDLSYMDGAIDGLAFFVGRNHGFALSAVDYPGVKPDSVYYTEAMEFVGENGDSGVENLGHDIGIFDYRDRVVSPCYYPCDVQETRRIAPAPMWFTPSPFQ